MIVSAKGALRTLVCFILIAFGLARFSTWIDTNLPPNEPVNLAYIHAYVREDGSGLEILVDMINSIRKNGLYDRLHLLFIGLLGDSRMLTADEFNDPKIQILFVSDEVRFVESS